jgi:hypothetical protein
MSSLSRFAITKFSRVSFGGRFLACSGYPARARAVPDGTSLERLTSLMDSHVVLRHQSVSPFTLRHLAWGYFGSADTLEEEAAKATFSSPPRCRAFSPVAYRLDLPSIGRRRASPVMTQDHFLQAATRSTQVVHPRQSARTEDGARLGTSSTLHPRAVTGAPPRPKTPSPGVILLGPFVTPPSPDLPVATRWLLTPAVGCGVRARCSARARTRTGRLWRVILLSSPHPFF